MSSLKSVFGKIAILLVCMSALAVIAQEPAATPNFSFIGVDGNRHTLAEFKGQWVLINLWATWCGPCVQEMPALSKLQDDYKGKMKVLTIAEGDTIERVMAFYVNHNISNLTPFSDDKSEISVALRITGLPTTLIVSPEGKLMMRFKGSLDWNSEKARKALDETLKSH